MSIWTILFIILLIAWVGGFGSVSCGRRIDSHSSGACRYFAHLAFRPR
jgi:hypothetical protein